MNHRQQLRPLDFDEQRALEDLQKLHRDIQRVRGEREQAEAEFETFVGGFQAGDPHATPPVVAREPRRDAPAPPVAREVRREVAPVDIAPSPETRVPVAPPVSVAPPPPVPPPSPQVETPPRLETAPPAAPSAVAEPKPSAAPTIARRVHPAVGIAIAALIVVGVLFAIFGGRDAEPVRDVPAGAVAPPPEPQPAEPAQAPPATPQAGVNLEMITIRPVWVRVTVDGRRAIERELPAGERIPLHAEQTIMIRAGDAGAIAVRRGTGPETRLGENGIVATRTFTAERRGEGTTGR